MAAKYIYTICDVPSEEYFKKQCEAIEKSFTGLKKARLIEDIDGSSLQIYHHEKGDIKICNDYYDNCLYIESDFNLSPYFN